MNDYLPLVCICLLIALVLTVGFAVEACHRLRLEQAKSHETGLTCLGYEAANAKLRRQVALLEKAMEHSPRPRGQLVALPPAAAPKVGGRS